MHTSPELPIPEFTDNPQPFETPKEVDLCYEAVCKGDVDGVKEQVQRLLHNDEAVPAEQKPDPRWLFYSLGKAIEQKDVEIVRFLLENDVAGGDLPGEIAVRSGAYKILELFLDLGWDINKAMGRNRPSVLSIPLSTSDEVMVTWLLDHDADPNSRCEWDLTPTSHAMLYAPLETIKTLFQRKANTSCGQLLHYAVLRDGPDALAVVRFVVEQGAPLNEVKYKNHPVTYKEREPFGLGTPLHRAAEFGKLDIVEYLLENGANPLILDTKKKTPRFWAEEKGHTDVASILEEAEKKHWPQHANIGSTNT
ncbi:ankyrin [Decorospora gaudefroyi]|uniref:Ankyrin n=1 Tax=Decorospora gaudefroyi TaxID=184978 RepID=A0A6A5JWI7_9PLEO|nr:ankyrin [Decorospora gaudefroyi]